MGRIEIHPRTFSQRFGDSPSAQRTFIDTPNIDTFEALPVIGEEHPEFAALTCVGVERETGYNGDPDQISYRVSYAPAPACEQAPNPLERCDRWSIGGGSTTEAITSYYDGTTMQPLVNSAGDAITGYQKRRSDLRLTVAANRATFPIATARAVINTVNESGWGGGAPTTWICSGASAQQRTELVGTLVVDFWAITFEFLYRESGWRLVVPNVGFNYIGYDGIKRRMYIEDQDGNYIPSPKPLPLESDGFIRLGNARPDLMAFDIYRTSDFSAYFGDPPL